MTKENINNKILKELKDLNWKLSFLVRTQGYTEQRRNIVYLSSNGLSNRQIASLINKDIGYIAKEISLWKKEQEEQSQ